MHAELLGKRVRLDHAVIRFERGHESADEVWVSRQRFTHRDEPNLERSAEAKQLSGIDPVHAEVGHWALMAGLASSLVGVIGLTALRTEGWRLPLWSAGLATLALGIASIAMPTEASSFGLLAGTAAVLWGAASIAVSEIAYRRPNSLSIDPAVRPI